MQETREVGRGEAGAVATEIEAGALVRFADQPRTDILAGDGERQTQAGQAIEGEAGDRQAVVTIADPSAGIGNGVRALLRVEGW
jgi:hypothetical protein